MKTIITKPVARTLLAILFAWLLISTAYNSYQYGGIYDLHLFLVIAPLCVIVLIYLISVAVK